MTETTTRPSAYDVRGSVHAIHYDLSYIKQGDLSDPTAPTIVLLHDFPGDATVWRAIMPTLTAHPVLAFDLLGYGLSAHPWPADTSVWGHADVLNAALRLMDLRQVILVGFGLGGGIAQILATRLMPELVKGLVLIDTYAYQYSLNANWPMPDMVKRQDPEAPRHTSEDDLVAALRETIPQGSANPNSISGATLDAYITPWKGELNREILFEQIRRLVPYYLNAVGADLAHLAIPTLIVWGERDTVVSLKVGQQLARAIPNSHLEIVSGAGHLILNDAPTKVASLVGDFTRGITK